jgi:putative heme-binding domain-containing protein
LQHTTSWWRLIRRGSTFAANYGGILLDSHDTWFCATDMCQGPDGALYVCDFYDQRTAHPDPDANWDRSNGRIYRIAPPRVRAVRGLDLTGKTSDELVELLRHSNGWYAQRARVLLATRRDRSVWSALESLARQTEDSRLSLQGLWGLYVSGGFNDALAAELLRHPAEFVRAWTVRLLGDAGKVSPKIAANLVELAANDSSVIVRCQLAATARRLPGADGLAVVERLLRRGLDQNDLYMPLMIWWAVEAKALTDAERLLVFFDSPQAWTEAGIRANVLRLVRRYAAEGTRVSYEYCLRLLAKAPAAHRTAALDALDRGLAERAVALGGMGMSGLYESIAAREKAKSKRRYEPLTTELVGFIAAAWRDNPADATRLRLALRVGVAGATTAVSDEIANLRTTAARRRILLGLLGEVGSPACVPAALAVLEGDHPDDVRDAALDAVAQFGNDSAAARLLAFYPKAQPALRSRLREVLMARPVSARAFLERVDRKEIPASEVPVEQLRAVKLHGDAKLDALVRKHWGSVQAGTPEEMLAEIRRLSNDLRAGTGDAVRGKALFTKHCATCHKLFGEGGMVGPDLTVVARNDRTALLANIVDPSAVIRAEYLQYTAVTTSGRVVHGVLAAQDGASVTLLDAQGKRTTLPRDSIEELRELSTSIMPENLLKQLRPQEVRDLFRYLQSSGL